MTPADRLERYQRATVEGIASDLANAAPGGRNAAANVAAFQLGTLGRHGLVTEDAARELVAACCEQLGLPRSEALATFKSGWRKGYAQGRELPADIESILRTGTAGQSYRPSMPRGKASPEPAPVYPPRDEVLSVWAACETVADDSEASDWLKSRGISPDAVSRLDLARALLPGPAPAWAQSVSGTPYETTGHRLAVPLYDASGATRSLVFRCVRSQGQGDAPPLKSKAPRGFARKGLVMANGPACDWLKGGPLKDGSLVIREGEKDFLRWATRPELEHLPIVGIVEGAWSGELVARIPKGSRLSLATDNDPAGEKYAAGILKTLAGRTDLHIVRHLESEAT